MKHKGHDPLIDVRDRNDSQEAYYMGLIEHTQSTASHSHDSGTGESIPYDKHGSGKFWGHGCWCGDTYGHDWPGKAEGKPHPRESGREHNEQNGCT